MTTFKKRTLEVEIMEGAYNGAIRRFLDAMSWDSQYCEEGFDLYEFTAGAEPEEAFNMVYDHLTAEGKIYWQLVKNACDKILKM